MATLFPRHGQPYIVAMEPLSPVIRSPEDADRLTIMLEVVAAISLFLRRHPSIGVSTIDTQIFWLAHDGWESDTVPIVYNMGGSVQIDWPGVAPRDKNAIEKIVEWCAEEKIPIVHHRR